MNTLLIVGIVVAMIAVAGATIYFTTISQSNEIKTNNTSTTYTSSTSTFPQAPSGSQGTTTSMISGEVDITGAWHGVYNGTFGSGRWSFLIWKTNDNTYHGLLRTDGAYSTNGESIPLTIVVNGDNITLGAVAISVTFTGTVSGDQMSGTWRLNNGYDSGSWTGVRGANDLTPENKTITTSATTSNATTTTLNPYDSSIEIKYPPALIGDILRDIKTAFTNTKGGAKLIQGITSQDTYVAVFIVKNSINDPLSDLKHIVNEMNKLNYTTTLQPTMLNTTTVYTILSISINTHYYYITIYVNTGQHIYVSISQS